MPLVVYEKVFDMDLCIHRYGRGGGDIIENIKRFYNLQSSFKSGNGNNQQLFMENI